ncbi:GNAT family N-acetyltransferase [Peribacillus alkalitolerans]|uniref:GNAT family N-acetyltransferase n=1 Tax=Peribacillus alkalitolerans TaxID=1550385 RepID=UPI0013D2DE69|nr:GNAT family N-acetyltransferase [Peribacillus alkalitolerans]
MTIRKANIQDKKYAAELMYLAMHDIAEALTGENEQLLVQQGLEELYLLKGNRLSHENCLVKCVDDKVVGIVILYHGSQAQTLDRPIQVRLFAKLGSNIEIDSEADLEDFYIDTLSVFPEHGGKGYGTELLKQAFSLALENQYSTISLNAETENSSAIRLYKRLGFKEKKEIRINNSDYYYMVKELEKTE